jgi:hypothetical protein
MYLLIIFAAVILAFWVYVGFIRNILALRWPKTWAWFDEIEGRLWRHSRTLLASRLYWVGGLIVAAHDLLAGAGMDWMPLTTEIANLIDPRWRPIALAAFLVLTGMLFEWLKRTTAATSNTRVD